MQIKLTVEYDGTAYHGWQIQPNGETVQGVLERAAARLLSEPVRMTAAGRTDAGVHAAGQVVCFRTERTVDPAVIQYGMNALTPADIVVRAADIVPDDFDPRRSASSRTYVYRIWNHRTPSVFWRRYAWHLARPLDLEPMAGAAGVLVGEHDFSAFQAAGCDAEHAVRRVYRSEVSTRDEILLYTIEATAYLRHMVRNIVGTLVEIGVGARRAADFESLLHGRDRTRAGPTAPAHGLSLLAVHYPNSGAPGVP